MPARQAVNSANKKTQEEPERSRSMLNARLVFGAVLAMGLAVAAESQAQQPKVFNLGYVGRQTSPEGIGITAFAEEVKKRSNGRLEIRQHPGGALGGEREMLEGIQIGTVDIVTPATAVVGNFVPE